MGILQSSEFDASTMAETSGAFNRECCLHPAPPPIYCCQGGCCMAKTTRARHTAAPAKPEAAVVPATHRLLGDIRSLIESARERTALAKKPEEVVKRELAALAACRRVCHPERSGTKRRISQGGELPGGVRR
jgi:hypothetical protein